MFQVLVTNDIPTVVIVKSRSSIALVKRTALPANGGVGDT
jgi:hypothetical protein